MKIDQTRGEIAGQNLLSDDSASIARWLAWFDSLEPLHVTPEEQAAWRRKRRDWEKSQFDRRAERLKDLSGRCDTCATPWDKPARSNSPGNANADCANQLTAAGGLQLRQNGFSGSSDLWVAVPKRLGKPRACDCRPGRQPLETEDRS
jgi:hypothetical protein